MMEYSNRIAYHGAEAVKKYRILSGINQDNEVPEIFLGGQIAIGLNRDFSLQAHVERPYLTIIKEAGRAIDSQFIEAMGGLRADVALYNEGKPLAIIELKICDERDRRGGKVLADIEKMKLLSDQIDIATYMGVLLTDTDKKCDERRIILENILDQRFKTESHLETVEGGSKWNWRFIAGKFH